jgi:hypothetical protein
VDQLVAPLLRAGSNKRQVDCRGQTALDYARERNHADIAALLSQ